MSSSTMPSCHQIITWIDPEPTGAVGWIVIHSLVNGVSGGGLFMHEGATQQEVVDLAYSMRFKNALQKPIFGGGKGGIRFDVNDPRAKGVLSRFLRDHAHIIETCWCTGGDINTSTEVITELCYQQCGLASPFVILRLYVRA